MRCAFIFLIALLFVSQALSAKTAGRVAHAGGPLCNPGTEFTCVDGYLCVLREYVCDGEQDCYDNSDELYCSRKK
uniref:Uncharacterized protein n=1 Tax=Panagrolaimus superbus TaxID=310955 RepID=A0A914YWE3_9BILA